MNSERMRKSEWVGTMLSAGLVLAVAVVFDSQPARNHLLVAASLGGSFFITVAMVLLVRLFSGKPTPESVRLHQEVHP